MKALITEDAFAAISNAVDEGKRRGMELGGSIVAIETKDTVLVAYAIPTGPDADQGPGHLRTDANFQNHALAAIAAYAPELVYVGDWHVHPMWLPTLSGTDRRTVEGILRDEHAHRDQLLLLLGTARPSADPIVLGFVAQMNGNALRIGDIALERVSRDSDEVISRFGRKLPPLEDILTTAKETHPVAHHQAAHRIYADLELLRKNLGAMATSWGAGELLGAIVRRGSREAFVLFPPEYPIGAPQVFAGSLKRGPLRPIRLRYGWSSLHCLTDLVEIALKPPATRRNTPQPSTFTRFFDDALAFLGISTSQTPTQRPSNTTTQEIQS